MQRGSLAWRSLLWTQRLWRQTRQAVQHHLLLLYRLSGNTHPMHLAGATPFPHQPECHSQASNHSQLRLPPGRLLSPPRQGRRLGWRGARRLLLPGRLPPGTLWVWWMRPSLSRTSSKLSLPVSTWQRSVKSCRSRRQIGKRGCLTKRIRKLGARAKPGVTAVLHCHHLCLQLRTASPVFPDTGLYPDSGSHRGQSQRPICPPQITRGRREHMLTNLCTQVTPAGVGSNRKPATH